MGNVLIFVEHAEGHVRTASLPAVTFGQQAASHHGGKLYLMLVGANVKSAAAEAAQLGAAGVLTVEDPGLGNYLAETYAPIVARVAKEKGATLVGGTATNLGKDLLPRVTALLDVGMASDVSAVLGPKQFKRPMQAGNVLTQIEVLTDVVVASVRQTEFAPAQPGGAAAPVEAVPAGALDPKGAAFVSLSTTKSERPELTDAKVVVSGGRGMREGNNFKFLEEIADLLGGAMGASRAACDAGMVPNDLQVGQTGKVVAPQLYIAVAISGAIQHLAGMKGSKVIAAINKDPEAPIFQVADYGLIGTWEKALPELKAEIEKLKAAQR